jgi:hypothetical protein
MACLHSMLYLLQCDGQLERDVISSLLPQTADYLKMYLRHTSSTTNLCHSEDHVALMWALAFYILEYKHEHVEQVSQTPICDVTKTIEFNRSFQSNRLFFYKSRG